MAFSAAVVLWEIVTGERPRRGSLRPPAVPRECPAEVADLIRRCTSPDPAARPTAQQAMEQLGAMLRRSSGSLEWQPARAVAECASRDPEMKKCEPK